jgi:hypothetical protein
MSALAASENRQLCLLVLDIDTAMQGQCTHLASQVRGDILARTTDLEMTDHAKGHGCFRKQFVIDVKGLVVLMSALAAPDNRQLGDNLGLLVLDIDTAMQGQCTHLTSKARGDILARTTDLEMTGRANGALLFSQAVC